MAHISGVRIHQIDRDAANRPKMGCRTSRGFREVRSQLLAPWAPGFHFRSSTRLRVRDFFVTNAECAPSQTLNSPSATMGSTCVPRPKYVRFSGHGARSPDRFQCFL